MANPQKENGYTPISNEILERLILTDISVGELKVILFVLRKTYGWHRKEDAISLSQFSEGIGVTRRGVCYLIKQLVKRGILGSERQFPTFPTKYWLIKDYNKWEASEVQSTPTRFTRASEVQGTQLVKPRTHTKDNKEIERKKHCPAKPDCAAPILYLNIKAGTSFNPSAKTNVYLIKARYAEGHSITDFKKVVDLKCAQWLTSEKMMQFLRPKTLFNASNFESYLNERKSDVPESLRKFIKDDRDHKTYQR